MVLGLKKWRFCFVLLLLLCLSPLVSLQAQPQKPQPPRNWATVWGWATAPWESGDKPYQQIRATIDGAIAAGQKPQSLAELYAGPALRQPNDAKAQFRWAYATYKEAGLMSYDDVELALGKPREQLILAPFPNSYEYARLIFLTEDYIGMPNARLWQVGKRLVRYKPDDRVVKYAAANNLIFSKQLADRNLADQYVHELLMSYPDWSKPHGLVGFIAYRKWQKTKSKQDAGEAIAEYQAYLRLDNSKDADLRKRIQDTVAEIQKG